VWDRIEDGSDPARVKETRLHTGDDTVAARGVAMVREPGGMPLDHDSVHHECDEHRDGHRPDKRHAPILEDLGGQDGDDQKEN
jgi:hypothetical protein